MKEIFRQKPVEKFHICKLHQVQVLGVTAQKNEVFR